MGFTTCPHCGKQVLDATFCIYCGALLKLENREAAQQAGVEGAEGKKSPSSSLDAFSDAEKGEVSSGNDDGLPQVSETMAAISEEPTYVKPDEGAVADGQTDPIDAEPSAASVDDEPGKGFVDNAFEGAIGDGGPVKVADASFAEKPADDVPYPGSEPARLVSGDGKSLLKKPILGSISNKAKRVLVGSGIAVAAVSLTLLTLFLFIPMYHYNVGAKLMGEGAWEEAVASFQESEGFSDAENKIQECHYEFGADKAEEGLPLEAAEQFSLAGDYSDAVSKITEMGKRSLDVGNVAEAIQIFGMSDQGDNPTYESYAGGLDALSQGKFKDALSKLSKAKDVPGTDAKIKEASYGAGKEDLTQGDYKSARTHLESAGDYADASTLVFACDMMQAEDKNSQGNLKAAADAYANIPDGVVWGDYDSTVRKQQLATADGFVSLCGEWKGTGGSMRTMQIWRRDTDHTRWWTGDPGTYGGTVDVHCVLNLDGTVTLKGTVSVLRYSNYSSVSKALDTRQESSRFTTTLSSTPAGMDAGNGISLTWNGDGWTASYSKTVTNEDQYFIYQYDSNIDYGNKSKSY